MSTILDKIRKVLAKAEGTDNPHEAEMLMAKVEAMLEEHNFSMLDVAKAGEDPIGTTHDAAYCWVSNSWVVTLSTQLARLYGCRTVTLQRRNKISIALSGRESGRVTFQLMLPFVLKQVRAEARANRDNDITGIVAATGWDWDRAASDASIKGIGSYERAVGNALAIRVAGLWRAAEARDADRVARGDRALVPVDMVEAEMYAAHPGVYTKKPSTVRTTAAAKASAERVSLHRQTTGANTLRIAT